MMGLGYEVIWLERNERVVGLVVLAVEVFVKGMEVIWYLDVVDKDML